MTPGNPEVSNLETQKPQVAPQVALGLLFAVFASTPNSHDLCDLLGLEATSRALSGPGLIICYICEHPK